MKTFTTTSIILENEERAAITKMKNTLSDIKGLCENESKITNAFSGDFITKGELEFAIGVLKFFTELTAFEIERRNQND